MLGVQIGRSRLLQLTVMIKGVIVVSIKIRSAVRLPVFMAFGILSATTASAQTIELQTTDGVDVLPCATVASAVLTCPYTKTGTVVVIAERDYYPYWHPTEFECKDLAVTYANSDCPKDF